MQKPSRTTLGKSKKTNFIVLATSRTGSNWLIELLNSCSQIRAFEEIFINKTLDEQLKDSDPALLPAVRFYDYRQSVSYKRPRITFKYLNMLDKMYQGYNGVGFKLMYGQLKKQPEIILKVIWDQYKIIHLTRNYLDVLLSREFAKRRGIWHSKIKTKSKISQVYLDPKLLLENLEKEEKQNKHISLLLRLIPVPVLNIYYEDLCKNTKFVLAEMQDFLTLSDSDFNYNNSFVRLNIGYHWQKIENYDAVRQALAGTKFYDLIDIQERL